MRILGIVVELANLVPSVSHLTAPWSEAHEGEHQWKEIKVICKDPLYKPHLHASASPIPINSLLLENNGLLQ